MFNNFFSENRAVYEIMPKNVVETEGPQMTSQYGANALRAGLTRLHARMHMHTSTRLGTHIHARTRKHAHTDQYVILVAFPQQQWFRERASCCVIRTLPVLFHLSNVVCHFPSVSLPYKRYPLSDLLCGALITRWGLTSVICQIK